MSNGPANGHEWAERRLLAYSAGMLPEEEFLALEEHLRSCTDCRARLAQLKPAAGADPGHLPASLIATWPRSSALLEGLERELVESHLRSCESCRATLAFAGHAPALAREPAAAPGGVRTVRSVRFRRAWMWALGLSGAAAGVTVWLIGSHPGLFHGGADERTSATMGVPGKPRAAPVTFELAVDSLAAGAVSLPQPGFRGTPAKPLDIGAVTSVSGVVLVLPPALRPPSPEAGERRLVMTLLGEGRELASRSCPFYALGDAIRIRPEGRLAPGDYDLRFALAPAAAAEPPIVWFYRLRVR